MNTIAPRLIASLATGFAAYFALWVERTLHVTLAPNDRDMVTGAAIALALALYSAIHRWISRTRNPDDVARHPDAQR